MALEVDADLTVSRATVGGDRIVGRLSSDGGPLTLYLERPGLMGAGLKRHSVGRLGDLLAASGLRLHVIGRRGTVAVLGGAGGRRLDVLLTGSRNVVVTLGPGAAQMVWAARGPPLVGSVGRAWPPSDSVSSRTPGSDGDATACAPRRDAGPGPAHTGPTHPGSRTGIPG